MVFALLYLLSQLPQVSSAQALPVFLHVLVMLISGIFYGVHSFLPNDFTTFTVEGVAITSVNWRYLNWGLTTLLAMLSFPLLAAAYLPRPLQTGIYFGLAMIIIVGGGYIGESDMFANGRVTVLAMVMFFVSFSGFVWLLLRIYGMLVDIQQKMTQKTPSEALAMDLFKILFVLVALGWLIYPVGYFFSFLYNEPLWVGYREVVYNLADFINKIFLALLALAIAQTLSLLAPAPSASRTFA
jgi:bacteriorhodopsin